ITSRAKPWELVFWWIIRALMVYAMIDGIIGVVKGTGDLSDPLQVFGNLLAMFTWEAFMATSEKRFTHYMPSYMQDVMIVMVFAASFCGKFLNFYYDVLWWDSTMHLTSGALCTLLGYEVVVAMQKRDKKTVSLPIAILCALGFSFFVSTCWELFEFTADQFMCKAAATAEGTLKEGGVPGDAQHWCWRLAEGTPKAFTFLKPYFTDAANGYDRWPLMDTMQDTVLNSVGAFIALIILKLFPYKHRGDKDINKIIENENKSGKKKELVMSK
ncbi:MAG: hypothetical protein KBT46_07470, partial [Ruminococcus sp.]|nr:hypothetical protein [Candidatus Copronaster equi]